MVGYGDNPQKASQEPQPEPVAEAKPEPVVKTRPEPAAKQPAPVKKSRSDVADLLDELDSKI